MLTLICALEWLSFLAVLRRCGFGVQDIDLFLSRAGLHEFIEARTHVLTSFVTGNLAAISWWVS